MRSPRKAFAAVRDELMCGPAGRFATDVREEIARRPADVVIAEQAMFGAMLAAEAENLPRAALVPNPYPLPSEGRPPFGTGWAPARGPLGRVRDRVVNAATVRMWQGGLPALNAARREHGLPPLPRVLAPARAPRPRARDDQRGLRLPRHAAGPRAPRGSAPGRPGLGG